MVLKLQARPVNYRTPSLHGWWVCLALCAMILQAPTLTVRHAHAGGEVPHHHGVLGCGPSCAAQTARDIDLHQPGHGHRLVWGLELHDPAEDSSRDTTTDHPDNPGLICAAQGPATLENHADLSAQTFLTTQNLPALPLVFPRPLQVRPQIHSHHLGAPQAPLVLKI